MIAEIVLPRCSHGRNDDAVRWVKMWVQCKNNRTDESFDDTHLRLSVRFTAQKYGFRFPRRLSQRTIIL